MGLLKETMQAIIRIDRNLAEIRKSIAWERDAKYFRAAYQQKPIEKICSDIQHKIDEELSLFDRLPQLEIFPYPSNLTLGGRFTAIRKFHRLKQDDVATALDVTPSYISRIEADKVIPSATIIRFFALNYHMNETWLATGHLPQTTEEPFKHIANRVVPLSGYGGGDSEYANLPREILIDRGDDRGLLAVHRPPLVDQNVGQKNA